MSGVLWNIERREGHARVIEIENQRKIQETNKKYARGKRCQIVALHIHTSSHECEDMARIHTLTHTHTRGGEKMGGTFP